MSARSAVPVLAALLALSAAAAAPAGARSPAPKPRCAIGPITYSEQTGLVVARSGQCYLPKYSGHARRKLPVTWRFSWTGYDADGASFGAGSKGSGKRRTFTLDPVRFDHVRVTFTVAVAAGKGRATVSAARTQTIRIGGVGLIGTKLGAGPAATPPPVTGGVNPLCPFEDSYPATLPNPQGPPQCGTVEAGSCAFVTPPVHSDDGTVRAGRWLCPTGHCLAVKPRGPYTWFGLNVYAVNGYECDGGVGGFGVATITLVDRDGSQCTLHPDYPTGVAAFTIPPAWGGTLKVTFLELSADRKTGKLWPNEYETAEFVLKGSENGCASPDWKIAPVG